MKKKIIAIFLAAACIQVPANAMTADFLKDNETYSISGTAEEARYNQLISIKVENEAKEIVYFSCVQTDNKGNFSYKFGLGEPGENECPTGKYTLYIGAADAEEPERFEFIYLNSYDREHTLSDINTWSAQYKLPDGDKAAMSQNLVSLTERMGFAIDADNKYFNGLDAQDKKAAAGCVLEKGTFADIDEFLEQFNRYSAIFGLRNANADAVKDIFDNYSEVLHLEQAETKVLFDGVNKTPVYRRLAGNKLNSDSEFNKGFNEAVLLAKIESAVSWGDVLNLITGYENNFPFAFNGFTATKEQIAKNIAGKSYDNMAALQAAAGAVNNTSAVIPAGGGSGGGGGSSTGSVKLWDTVTENTQNRDLTQVFADIDDAAWAKEAINSLYDKNVIAGVDKTHFAPNNNITREAFVKIIVDAFGFTSDDAAKEFNDLPKGHWAYKQIAAANALGIVSGINDTEFGTGMAITREDMMVICCRAADKAGITLKTASNTGTFTDKDDISDYAQQYVEKLVSAGFVSGFEDGSVQPKGTTTRAQAAYLIYKLMGEI